MTEDKRVSEHAKTSHSTVRLARPSEIVLPSTTVNQTVYATSNRYATCVANWTTSSVHQRESFQFVLSRNGVVIRGVGVHRHRMPMQKKEVVASEHKEGCGYQREEALQTARPSSYVDAILARLCKSKCRALVGRPASGGEREVPESVPAEANGWMTPRQIPDVAIRIHRREEQGTRSGGKWQELHTSDKTNTAHHQAEDDERGGIIKA
ncbi:hypothetical protein BDZ89DRAFT_1044825 [Hymenopellis radicata]|nr:hypothetical protein BDZ89DRAFT_1044825 [Hymenopellis radicata]